METKTMKNTALDTLIQLYDMHTKFFHNVIDGISDEDAQNRLNTKANHVAWIAGSLVFQRYELARFFGSELQQSYHELFKDFKGIQDGVKYPSLAEYNKDWETITPILRDAMVNLSDEKLQGPDPFEMPGGDFTFQDSLTFSIDRESYCVGQIALYRRLLGYEAMKYE